VLYSQSPNLATVEMQAPYPFEEGANFVRGLKKEVLGEGGSYIGFNRLRKETKKRRPIR